MPQSRPIKWWSQKFTDGRLFRLDAFGLGEPDFHAYIVKYVSAGRPGLYRNAWCWILTMPRASSNTYNGWASSPHEAKRQVEKTVKDNW